MSADSIAVLPIPDASGLNALLLRQRAAFQRRGEPSSVDERRETLRKLEQALMERRIELADAMAADFGGRARQESLLELFVVIDDLRHAQSHLKRWMRTRKVSANWQFLPSKARLMPQPLGVIGVIGAYNYPVMTTLSPVVGALAAGNHVMMKPSSLTPRTTELLRQIVSALYAEDHVAVVTGDSSVAKQFSKLAFDHLVFTGSTRVGKLVMRDAAENLVPVTLELGGKCPAIVGEDYDLKAAAETIVQTKFLNAGQTCVTGDYALVPEGRVEEFLQHARAAILQFYPKLVDNQDYGRVLIRNDWTRLQDWVNEAGQRGAKVEVFNPANESCSADNRVYPPTLVSRVPTDTTLCREEIFGPVQVIVSVATLDEAIELINNNPNGNGVALFTQSGAAARKFQEDIDVGQVGINVPIPVPVPLFSFTGSRGSKLGDLGPYGKQVILFYTQTKTVTQRWFDDSTLSVGVNTTISLK